MSDLNPEIVEAVLETCQAGADEAAGACGRAFEGDFKVTVGEATTYSASAVPDGFVAGGLALLMNTEETSAVAIIPASSGLLPDWVSSPDATGTAKLDTLAQELGKVFLPEALKIQSYQSGYVPHIDKALDSAKVAKDASLMPLELTQGEKSGQISLIWPLNFPEKLLQDDSENVGQPRKIPKSFSELPPYSRSLLKVQVPVRVVLASRKETLKDVVEMSPGTLIKFEKACDQLLEMRVAEQAVAEGEAVKVGDKFGFRVISMLLPEEHFLKIGGKKAS